MWQKIKNSVFLNIILFALAIFLSYKASLMVYQAVGLEKEREAQEKKLEELLQKKRELEAYIAQLQTLEGMEREAKDRFNLKRRGEEVVVVVPEENKKEENTQATSTLFGDYFKNLFR